ncbi:MAG: FAD-dependent oxidoreductase [Rubrobacter sp.]|nr:FAD-dependent oxidoreductase [Rubrobacter sp.]
MDWSVHDRDEDLLRSFAGRYFPEGNGPTMDLQACMFTNTPDGHFILDLHPDYPQVSIASPCSGHGFKFASAVGEVMADLAEKGMTRHDIRPFGIERLRSSDHAGTNGAIKHWLPKERFRRSRDIRSLW